ncbi:tetratricopeptide repeat protein [Paenibacillus sp. OV219]|uniref:tetratricopeptide repeat protein n=1 Tax=Paenibacillus sp. OV219 TaxID=1884377 RepID=UPI0008D1599D|nr:tetratricopeptide repeat protein [Paenibacillus sp. OV219]SEN26491.1 Tetratricopeptide repeat-containing protein [Paenibacillus sp. OV219]
MDGDSSSIKKAYEAILSGDFEQAILHFEEAIALEPTNGAAYYKCSITCARSGKWQKSLTLAEQAVRLNPEQMEYQFHLENVKAKALVIEAESILSNSPARTEDALELLHEASRLDPLNIEALLMLGAAYATLSRYDEAAACARDAVRLEPEHSAARRLFADMNRQSRTLRAKSGRTKRRRNR